MPSGRTRQFDAAEALDRALAEVAQLVATTPGILEESWPEGSRVFTTTAGLRSGAPGAPGRVPGGFASVRLGVEPLVEGPIVGRRSSPGGCPRSLSCPVPA